LSGHGEAGSFHLPSIGVRQGGQETGHCRVSRTDHRWSRKGESLPSPEFSSRTSRTVVMRALVLLLLMVVSFLLVVKFYPAPSVVGAGEPDEPTEAEDGQTGFLVRDEVVPSKPAPAPADSPTAGREEPVPEAPRASTWPAENGIPDWLAKIDRRASLSEEELPVAQALVHGTLADLHSALRIKGNLPPDRARMAEAFAVGIEDAKTGLEIATRIDETSLTAREKALLQAAIGGNPVVRPLEASEHGSPLVQAMEIRLASLEAESLLAARRFAEASRAISDLLLAEVDAPWPASPVFLARWSKSLEEAQAHHRWNPEGSWPGVEMEVQRGDSAVAIRKRFLAAHSGRIMSAGLILEANAVRGHLQPGQRLRIPTDPVLVLIDLSARWALYFMGKEVTAAWPIGIGRPGEETPTGEYVAGTKLENPSWMRPGQEPIPFGDPRNPLGSRWIGWMRGEEATSYGFHGTREPESIGTPSSDGCVRFHDAAVERLFEILPVGARILVRD